MSYAFYCSKCKVDHAGECPPARVISIVVDPEETERIRRFQEALTKEIEALVAKAFIK